MDKCATFILRDNSITISAHDYAASPAKKMYYVYLLESKTDRSWYIGYSSDLRSRFASHNKGENAATKNKRPWKLIYYEAYIEKADAKGRELFLKSGSGRRFLKKQIKNYLEK